MISVRNVIATSQYRVYWKRFLNFRQTLEVSWDLINLLIIDLPLSKLYKKLKLDAKFSFFILVFTFLMNNKIFKTITLINSYKKDVQLLVYILFALLNVWFLTTIFLNEIYNVSSFSLYLLWTLKTELYASERGKCLRRELVRVDADQDYTNPSKVWT